MTLNETTVLVYFVRQKFILFILFLLRMCSNIENTQKWFKIGFCNFCQQKKNKSSSEILFFTYRSIVSFWQNTCTHTNTNKPSRIMTKIELYLRPLITLTNPSIKNIAFVGGKGAAKPWGEWAKDALEFSRAPVLASRVKTARVAALPRKLSHARKQFCQLKGPLKMPQKFSSALNSCLGS